MKRSIALFVWILLWLTLGREVVFSQTSPTSPQTSSPTPLPSTREELESLIKARATELEKINRDLETTEENLRTTKSESASLERQMRTLDSNIKQLELNIKGDEITSQKLGLEVDSLNYDIRDIEISVGDKQETIVHLLRELQKKDESSLLVVFLRNGSLADSVLETQSLSNLRSQLSVDILGLKNLKEQLSEKVQDISTKKDQIELSKKNFTARKGIVEDQKEERKTILVQTKSKESVYEQQLENLKKQQDAVSDEIDKIESQLRSSFDVSVLPIKRPGVFLWPVILTSQGGRGRITQHFGEQSYLYKGKPHNGLDIGAPIGTPVVAADDGTVIAVDNNDRTTWSKYQYGKYILIRHPNNLTTLYGHLSKQTVQRGQEIKRGMVIGYSGNTGFSTGAHLHFGAYWAPSIIMKSVPPASGLVPIGVTVNPEEYL